MGYYSRLVNATIVFLLLSFSNDAAEEENQVSVRKEPMFVNVGVVLDLNSLLGSTAHFCIKMAILDFYEAHPNYTTQLHLQAKNAESLTDASFAALELVKDEDVKAIIGPQTETANSFIAELGEKFHVPIISFTARSSRNNHYFIRMAPDDVLQTSALAAMCKEFEWPEVVVLYEDMDHGNQFLYHLHKAFQEVEVGLAATIPFHASDSDMHLSKELGRLKVKKTRVFLVHMNPLLGYRFFTLAKGIDLMREEYAWIITDSISNFMSSVDLDFHNSMQGVVGLRPYVHMPEKLQVFQERLKSKELNVYGLWAYDAATALAIAAENIGATNSTHFTAGTTNFKIQTFGEQLLHELSKTKFKGLAGNFIDGKLEGPTYEIFNVYGSGERNMGFWTPGIGLTTKLTSTSRETLSESSKGLKGAIWPGDSNTPPTGLSIPTNGKLRVGILLKKGFRDFVHVTYDARGNKNLTGFAIDIFKATLLKMPTVDYEFRVFNGTNNSDWSYDDILHEIPKKFDMVVGATTIWAPRAEYVHFSLPYSESGAIMVVRNKKPVSMWTFIKPLRVDLWLAFVGGLVIIILVIWKMERGGQNFLSSVAAPFLTFFADSSMVKNNWSLVVLLFCLFTAYITKQINSAKLSAILANDQLEFAYSDKYHVGYQEGSFMKQFLMEHLHISEARLKSCSSPEEYHAAMTLGSKNGGIDVIFDEIPYMRILLKKYGSEYKMVPPVYKTGGFGFAFPIGSPLVTYFSKAILNVTQGPEMSGIENKNFGAGYTSHDPLSSTISRGLSSSIILSEFSGLFIMAGSVAFLALFFSETKFGISIIQCLEKYISRTNIADTAPVQQSYAGSHGQDDRGANTYREAPRHSGDKTKNRPSRQSNDPQ